MSERQDLKFLMIIIVVFLVNPIFGLASISNSKEFLNTCPKNDPAYNKIINDFTIRHNGIVVSYNDIYCNEPALYMPLSQYTDEFLILQNLRFMYHMDLGERDYLPWTSGTLYDWIKSKIRGFNIDDTAAFNSCCTRFSDGLYITLTIVTETTKSRYWTLPFLIIPLYAHEARHVYFGC